MVVPGRRSRNGNSGRETELTRRHCFPAGSELFWFVYPVRQAMESTRPRRRPVRGAATISSTAGRSCRISQSGSPTCSTRRGWRDNQPFPATSRFEIRDANESKFLLLRQLRPEERERGSNRMRRICKDFNNVIIVSSTSLEIAGLVSERSVGNRPISEDPCSWTGAVNLGCGLPVVGDPCY